MPRLRHGRDFLSSTRSAIASKSINREGCAVSRSRAESSPLAFKLADTDPPTSRWRCCYSALYVTPKWRDSFPGSFSLEIESLVRLRTDAKESVRGGRSTTDCLVDAVDETIAQNGESKPIGSNKVCGELWIYAPAVSARRAQHDIVAHAQT